MGVRKINSHIEALKTLFVLVELRPAKFGTGKAHLYLCDVSFATYLNASLKRQLETWYFQEFLAFQSYFGAETIRDLSYYRTSKGSIVDFVFQNAKGQFTCVKIHDREAINQLDVRILSRLAEKMDQTPRLICAAGIAREQTLSGVEIVPWEGILSR